MPAPPQHQNERRRVTVLFADMADFTSLTERFGEEIAHELCQSLYDLISRVVREEGCTTHHSSGDGVMAIFGLPLALEDATLRACRSALRIQSDFIAWSARTEQRIGVRPGIRIGVNSGPVIAGEIEAHRLTVSGDAVNFAARLQTLAPPGSVALSHDAHREVAGLVDSHFAGEHPVKGESGLQKIYILTGIRPDAVRFDAALSRGLSDYVGRDRELEALNDCLRRLDAGLCAADVSGEPGIGKSRLVYEFTRTLDREKFFILRGNCTPDGQRTPLGLAIDLLRNSNRIARTDTADDIRQKLTIGLTAIGLQTPVNLGLVLNLLGLPDSENVLKGLDGALVGLRTRELLQNIMSARCGMAPTVLVLEDLHWIDSASEELLAHFIETGAGLPCFVLHTRRPEYKASWSGRTDIVQIDLQPLSSDDTRKIVAQRLAESDLACNLVERVMEKAGGNALFAEEIASYLRERGKPGAVPSQANAGDVRDILPPNLHALLAARVDTLAPEDRTLLQAASVIGRAFDTDILCAALGASDDISARLDKIAAHGFLHVDPLSRAFGFKHALVRDAVYDSLIKDKREELHLVVAGEIERRSEGRLPEVAEILAYHFGQTKREDKQFLYLTMAGKKSLGVYSIHEAGNYLDRAAAIFDRSPDVATRQAFADFLIQYILYRQFTYKPQDIIDTFDKYREQIAATDEGPELVIALHYKTWGYIAVSKFADATRAQQDVAAMAERLGDDRSLSYAAAGAFFLGALQGRVAPDIVAAGDAAITVALRTEDAYITAWLRYAVAWDAIHRGHILRARALAGALAVRGGEMRDPRSTGLSLRLQSWIEIILGDADSSLKYSSRGLEYTITPFDRSVVESHQAIALIQLRQLDEGMQRLERTREFASQNHRWYEFSGTDLSYGLAQILSGRMAEGVDYILRCMATREKEGYTMAVDWYRVALAQIFIRMLDGRSRLPVSVLFANLAFLTGLKMSGRRKALDWLLTAAQNPVFDDDSFHKGNILYLVGMCRLLERDFGAALANLQAARRIVLRHGDSPTLAGIDKALLRCGPAAR